MPQRWRCEHSCRESCEGRSQADRTLPPYCGRIITRVQTLNQGEVLLKTKQLTVRIPWPIWDALQPKVRSGGFNDYLVDLLRQSAQEEEQATVLASLAALRERTRDVDVGQDGTALVRNLREGRRDK